MTKVEKYPHSVEAILQREAKNLVAAVWTLHARADIDDYSYKVQINTDLWEMLSDHQRDYFTSLFGGAWLIKPVTGRLGIWLCVRREAIYGFHYHAPLRVHPVRVYK